MWFLQCFLHIHPHGNRNSGTRAFGFTNKFITTMVAYNMSQELDISIDEVAIRLKYGASLKARSGS